jgi:uncharacterized protein YgbK (DUF1537 family)
VVTPFAFYADDLTGATDTMEILDAAGVKTVVFLEPPAREELDRFPEAGSFGVAGTNRSSEVGELDRSWPQAVRALVELGPRIIQYKVCSTFDSSPRIGNIGRALEQGARLLGQDVVPVLGGCPHLDRYCCFGNLFAGYDGTIHRLDRHPSMSRHPVTPAREADLVRVLGEQTGLPVRGLTLPELPGLASELDHGEAGLVVVDAMSGQDVHDFGRAVWSASRTRSPYLVSGPSSVALGLFGPPTVSPRPPPEPVDRLVVLSGSGSPVTATQIEHAAAAGFRVLPLPAEAEQAAFTATVISTLRGGSSVVVRPGAVPGDSRLVRERLARLAVALQSEVRRLVVCGGDTSAAVASRLGIRSIGMLAPLSPAAPLCRARLPGGRALEIAFKGGQMGGADYFRRALG